MIDMDGKKARVSASEYDLAFLNLIDQVVREV